MIDSHAHLFTGDFGQDLEDVLSRSWACGVTAIVVPGTNGRTSREAVELSARNDRLFACVGIHPHEAEKASEEDLAEIAELAAHPGVVAIGEIGLDYYYNFSSPERQKEVFLNQMLLAVERNLPVVIHTRESMSAAMETVRSVAEEHPAWRPEAVGDVKGCRGVFHCFTGTADQARDLFELGFFVSFPGMVTFKNSPVVPVLKEIGAKNILMETDSPYLAPVPHRGKRNEPSYLPLIAKAIAQVSGVPLKEVVEYTTANAVRLFSLKANVGTTQHF
ncbi:MAG: putative metal-dependent hydrolase YabD [Bacteroidia bacterium]|nr:MAG: putative metal-dependent hydrolase YabD [Bacteroidia bacterium]